MGMGGHLTWTGVARNVNRKLNQICKPSDDSGIFKNNPLLSRDGSFELNMSDPRLVYLHDGDRVKFKTKKHIIEFTCNELGIQGDIDLKCEIYLTDEEKNNAHNIIKFFPENYACIEPHSKTSWMQSRNYSFEKYQNIVNSLKDKIQFIQIGAPKSRALDNVIYTNGSITFRETFEILRNSNFFLSTEGGLVHLANAADIESFVIYTSYSNPPVTMYPENHLIDISLYRDEILGYKSHPLYKDEIDKHDESEITEKIITSI